MDDCNSCNAANILSRNFNRLVPTHSSKNSIGITYILNQ